MRDKISISIVLVCIILVLGLNTQCKRNTNDNKTSVEKTVEKKDTVIVTRLKTDTVFITNDKIRFKTIYINDTMYIEDKPYTYKDSTNDYKIQINGVKINWYNLDVFKKDTITKEITSIKYINNNNNDNTKKYSIKDHLKYGIGVGAGYGLINKQPDVYLGVFFGYSF